MSLLSRLGFAAPEIHGMGAFEGVQAAPLTAARTAAQAKAALHALPDDLLIQLVSDELRDRHGYLAMHRLRAILRNVGAIE